MPNLVAYFENNPKSVDSKPKLKNYDYTEKFISLLANYLSRQNVVDEELLNEIADQNVKIEANLFLECLSKQKLLTYLARLFEENKYSKSTLNRKVVECFSKRIQELEDVLACGQSLGDIEPHVQLFIIAPFILQDFDQASNKLAQIAQSLLAYQFKKLESKEQTASDLEASSFMFSLSIWSLMLNKSSQTLLAKMLNETGELTLNRIVDLLAKTEKYGRELRSNKDLAFLKLDKTLKHLLRSLNHVLTASKIASRSDLAKYNSSFKNSMAAITDMLKWQLASPYPDVGFISLSLGLFQGF